MCWWLCTLAVAATAAAAAAVANGEDCPTPGSGLAVRLSDTGAAHVCVDGTPWLRGRDAALHADGVWQVLRPASSGVVRNATAGRDDWGEYSCDELTLLGSPSPSAGADDDAAGAAAAHVNNSNEVALSVCTYPGQELVVLTQRFPRGANRTALGRALKDMDEVCTAFPRFAANGSDAGRADELGVLATRYFWDLDMEAVGVANSGYGLYGGAPAVLFDRHTLRAVVLSPLDEFKAGFQSRPAALGGDLACGLHGRIASIPPGYTHSTVLVASSEGLLPALEDWGDLMLRRYNKTARGRGNGAGGGAAAATAASLPVPPPAVGAGGERPERAAGAGPHNDGGGGDDGDPVATFLGYMTDTGAYYWYNPVFPDYSATLRAVRAGLAAAAVPVHWYNLDSWWYYKANNSEGEAGGIMSWEPRPDVFPRGMGAVTEELGHPPLMTHAKYFAPNNIYAQAGFPFMSEARAAVPLSNELWVHLMAQARQWGVTTWEQDWLASIFELMLKPSQDVYTAKQFHLGLAAGAVANNLTVQYCMPVVSDLLASLYNPRARYIRLSDDYSTNPRQWRIARPALVAHALGMVAFKDTFWTVSHQPPPGNPLYHNYTEPNPLLHAAVASLSAAGVAIGDAVNATNRSVAMRTCGDDGRLLRTARAALAIDASFRAPEAGRCPGDVSHTYVELVDGATGETVVWHLVLSANLSLAWDLRAKAELKRPGLMPARAHAAYDVIADAVVAASLPPGGVTLVLPASPAVRHRVPFHLHMLAPQLAVTTVETAAAAASTTGRGPTTEGAGWTLLGELGKFIPVSAQRFHSLTTTAAATATTSNNTAAGPALSSAGPGFSVDVEGLGSAAVTVRALSPAGVVVDTECLTERGPARLTCGSGAGPTCACAPTTAV